MKKEKVIELKPIETKRVIVTIEGDSDLVINKMNARSQRTLVEERKDKKTVRQVANMWEDIITAVHWRDPLPCKDTYSECDEEMYRKLLSENAPCITAFGFKKSLGDAVTQNKIAQYRTQFDATINIVAPNGLVPVRFGEAKIEERLMSPKKGSPVLVRLNHFVGWSADIVVDYTENVYSVDQIVNIINLAGFGKGIGSGRSSGYGRYHVVGVTAA